MPAVRDARCFQEVRLSRYALTLFITGTSPTAETALANLRRICDEALAGQYDLDIVDVLMNPQLAEDARILATPTLIRNAPLPARRVIGDLSDRQKLLVGLDIQPNARPADPNLHRNDLD